MLKKINAVLAVVTSLLFLCHTVAMGFTMFYLCPFLPVFGIIGKALMIDFSLHIVLSLVIMFFSSGKFSYPKLNKSIVEQRIAAVLLLIFVHFHMKNYFVDGAFVKQSYFGFITEILFTVIVMSHFMPSLDKVLVTLGIYSKPLEIIIRIIALSAFILSLAAILFYFLGALL